MMNEGWLCPKCGRGVAPGEKTCDHGGNMAAKGPGWPIPDPPRLDLKIETGGGQAVYWNGTQWAP